MELGELSAPQSDSWGGRFYIEEAGADEKQ